MNQLQRAAAIVGSILLGASLFFLTRGEKSSSRRPRRGEVEPPVQELAEHLKEAWAGYHTR